MSKERIIPPSVGEFAVEERQRLLDRIAELKAMLDRKVEFMRELAKDAAKLDGEIATLKARPSGVVLPPSPYMPDVEPAQLSDYEIGLAQGRCEMWEEVKRLNSYPVSAGNDESRHDAVKALHDVMQAVPCASLHSLAEAVLDAGYVKPSGAGGVDERAAFELFYTEKAKTLLLPLGNSPLRYTGGQYINGFALFGWMTWQARAALSAPCQSEQVRNVGSGIELAVLREFYRCCVNITANLEDSPKSAFSRLKEAVQDAALSAGSQKE